MNFIIYHLDSLASLAVKTKDNINFQGIKINNNYINEISKDSIFFKNSYGYGETWSTTFEYFTNGNMKDGYSDAFHFHNSFNSSYSVAKIFKDKNFTTFLYRDQKNYPNKGFYKRYFKSVSKDFDYFCLSKEEKIKSFKDFLKKNKTNFSAKDKKNKMFLIHDYSLHDNPRAYKKSNPRKYLKCVNLSAKKIEENLNAIKYDSTQDILIFLSDHGLNIFPTDKIHFDKNITKEEYGKYYLSLLDDYKIRTSFFIKIPGVSRMEIKKRIIPKDIFGFVAKIARFNFNTSKIIHFFNKIKHTNNKIIISVKAAEMDPYNNFFYKNCFHCHLVSISNNFKLSYSLNHPNLFYDFIKKKYVKIKKSEKLEIQKFLLSYYSKKKRIKKLLLFLFSYFFKFLDFIS